MVLKIGFLLILLKILPESIKRKLRQFLPERKKIKELYKKFVNPDDLVFDIGANSGDMTEIFLSLGAKVICVEPNPKCIKVLKRRFNGNKRVTLIEKGVSYGEGILPFYVNEAMDGMSTFSKKWKRNFSKEKWSKPIEVPVTTINKLIKEFGIPKLIKIDVEGFEFQVLKNLIQKLIIFHLNLKRSLLNRQKNV